MDKQTSKYRLLMLLQLLMEQSDEEHPLSTAAIIEYFQQQDIVTDRRTVKADAELLSQLGYDVIAVRGAQNQYFIGSRTFELPEVRLLMDAVCASRFITPAKSEVLIQKLRTLASTHQAETLDYRLCVSGRVKPINERIYYSAEVVRQAIRARKQVTFQYYEYTPQKEKLLKHNGRVYHFSPYDLIWNEDRYYVLGFSRHHGKVVSFRVDRMCDVQLAADPAIPRPQDYSVETYGSKVFDMFDGEEKDVLLSCENDLMRVIVDRFGEDVHIEPQDKDRFYARVRVHTSPTFYGWVFQFAGRVRIISPQETADAYRQMCAVCIQK